MGTLGSEAVKKAECGCCGLWEDCTSGYIGWVKERFGGVWVCGLCQEAIKDEQARLGVTTQVALSIHASFLDTITKTTAPPPHIAHSILQLIRKIISSSSSSKEKEQCNI
ncbi:hypothetical protein L6164_006355 [Bauhinia variegata]|uniref:Uncharacterized protein n=1 Tax=Bauhinia variegata TaxID=167791 RepID=A0ACB9PVZ9_BAUVA|nr:hypothetical protein L6164_006355 [Bauhinia variegata]